MFQGYISRLLAPVVLMGIVAIGLVFEGGFRFSARSDAENSLVATLIRVSELAQLTAVETAGIEDNRLPESANSLLQSLQQLPQLADDSQIKISEIEGGSGLLRLGASVSDFLQNVVDSTDRAGSNAVVDTPPWSMQTDDAPRNATDALRELSEISKRVALEVVALRDVRTIDTLWYIGSIVALSFAIASAMLCWIGLRFLHRLRQLPDRMNETVFGDETGQILGNQTQKADEIGHVSGRLADIAHKIRARLRENEKMERMAFADPLTGLPNRRGLLAFLDMLAEKDEIWEGDNKIGLIHIDLDHFKTINDTLGHDAGDTVLREATKRMSTAIRDSDLLARLGGDEFLVVATGIECEAEMTRIADRLIEQFQPPIMYEQRACRVGISMGLVLGGQRGRVRDPKRLLINADMALFKSKSEGRGRYSVFTSAMAEEARRRNERTIALGEALHEDAFRPWFQPMIDRATGAVVGLELLARWHDPERGVLMPHEFLDDAEASSLMEEIGLQVLAQALTELRRWRLSGATAPMIHMNLGRSQLLSANFVDRFSWTLDEANVSTSQFAIEVDEKDCTERGGEVAFENVRRLNQMGLQIVLDNFGAQQASLTILRGLNARMVKCTPQTIQRFAGEHGSDDIVRVLAALNGAAREMNVIISAKAVETQRESDLFLNSGIHLQQGDHLASVMNADEAGAFLLRTTAKSQLDRRKIS